MALHGHYQDRNKELVRFTSSKVKIYYKILFSLEETEERKIKGRVIYLRLKKKRKKKKEGEIAFMYKYRDSILKQQHTKWSLINQDSIDERSRSTGALVVLPYKEYLV